MTETKVAIIGSRGFNKPKIFKKELEIFLEENNIDINSFIIVSGGAKGADYYAKRYYKHFIRESDKDSKRYIELLPDWNKFGKSAGYRRNYNIWENSDIGIAFWDGVSKGTEHSFGISKNQGKKLKVIDYVNKVSYYV